MKYSLENTEASILLLKSYGYEPFTTLTLQKDFYKYFVLDMNSGVFHGTNLISSFEKYPRFPSSKAHRKLKAIKEFCNV